MGSDLTLVSNRTKLQEQIAPVLRLQRAATVYDACARQAYRMREEEAE